MNLELGFVAHQAERKYYGAYYTPKSVAEAMTEWAIRSPEDRVLEPSFGDGAFTHVAALRSAALGAEPGVPLIFGTDIDPAAVAKVTTAMRDSAFAAELRQADFLAVEPSGCWSGFDATLGNPPYVRHHSIDKGTIADLRRRELGLSGGADLWCAFVLHSVAFLKQGGRLAFVLPASFLFARYAEEVRNRLAAQFRSTVVIRLGSRTFADSGVDERGVVVLCSGYGAGPSLGWAERLAWDHIDLQEQIRRQDGPAEFAVAAQPVGMTAITTRTLGELAKVGIGFVTGANRTFIIDNSIRERFDLPASTLTAIVARTAQTPGVLFTQRDHDEAASRDEKVWLFAPQALGERHAPVRRYLATVARATRRNTLWFKKRPRWYQPQIGQRPDAVLTYMNHLGPRIVLLEGAEGATNTFHALTFNRAKDDPSPALITLAMLTSYAQLSAETVGRAYGGGVLKIEPSEARKIALPLPKRAPAKLNDSLLRADILLKAGEVDKAVSLADEVILKPMLGAAYETVRARLLRDLANARRFRLNSPRREPGKAS